MSRFITKVVSILLTFTLVFHPPAAHAGPVQDVWAKRGEIVANAAKSPLFWLGGAAVLAGGMMLAAPILTAAAGAAGIAATVTVSANTGAVVLWGLGTVGSAIAEETLKTTLVEVFELDDSLVRGSFAVMDLMQLKVPNLETAIKVRDSLEDLDKLQNRLIDLSDTPGSKGGVQNAKTANKGAVYTLVAPPAGKSITQLNANYKPEAGKKNSSQASGGSANGSGRYVVSNLTYQGTTYNSLLLRSTPGTASDRTIIGRSLINESLTYLGQEQVKDGFSWVLVQTGSGTIGWVKKGALTWVNNPPPPKPQAQPEQVVQPPQEEEKSKVFVVTNLWKDGKKMPWLVIRKQPKDVLNGNRAGKNLLEGWTMDFLGQEADNNGIHYVKVRAGGVEGWVDASALSPQ